MPTSPVVITKYGPGYTEFGSKIIPLIVGGFTGADVALNGSDWESIGDSALNIGLLYQQTGTSGDNQVGHDNSFWRIYAESGVTTAEFKATLTSTFSTLDPRGTYSGTGDSAGNEDIYIWGVPPEVVPSSQGTPNPSPPVVIS